MRRLQYSLEKDGFKRTQYADAAEWIAQTGATELGLSAEARQHAVDVWMATMILMHAVDEVVDNNRSEKDTKDVLEEFFKVLIDNAAANHDELNNLIQNFQQEYTIFASNYESLSDENKQRVASLCKRLIVLLKREDTVSDPKKYALLKARIGELIAEMILPLWNVEVNQYDEGRVDRFLRWAKAGSAGGNLADSSFDLGIDRKAERASKNLPLWKTRLLIGSLAPKYIYSVFKDFPPSAVLEFFKMRQRQILEMKEPPIRALGFSPKDFLFGAREELSTTASRESSPVRTISLREFLPYFPYYFANLLQDSLGESVIRVRPPLEKLTTRFMNGAYIILDPHLAHTIMQENDGVALQEDLDKMNLAKNGFEYKYGRVLSGENVFLTNKFQLWIEERQVLDTPLNKRLIEYRGAYASITGERIAAWKNSSLQNPDGRVHLESLYKEFKTLSLDTLLRSLFGLSLRQEKIAELNSDIQVLLQYFRMSSKYGLPWLFKDTPLPMARAFRESLQRFHEFSEMLCANIEGTSFEHVKEHLSSKEAVVNNIRVSLIAGFDTTATAAVSIAHFLSQHPEHSATIATELGGDCSTPSVMRSKTLKGVIDESLRLHPPVFAVTRWTNKDIEVCAENGQTYQVPENSMIILPYSLYHQHPNYWENPGDFDPYRFADMDDVSQIYGPFGFGGRDCAARSMALYYLRHFVGQLIVEGVQFEPFEIAADEFPLVSHPLAKVPVDITFRKE